MQRRKRVSFFHPPKESQMRISAFIATCAAIAACMAADANAQQSAPANTLRKDSSACAAARQAAWFERQRQLTDGDVDPFKTLPTPRECADSAMRTGAEARGNAPPQGDMKSAQSGEVKRSY
ncbi:MAG TPA: hypothetical protein VFP36_03575 [Usitatibacter sp.]|nr:hypothetical protein [Usitatibacter sp.]